MADCSEFQPDIHDATYLRWSKAIVIRALYGTRVDKAWYGGARRDALHAGGARFVGIYAYITGQDITAQAKAMISLLGKLRPGEKVIADIEEGPGNQQARWVTWAKAINAALHDPPWDYSGLNYAATHGLQPVTWVAAYGSREPSPPHKLWQFTDRYSVPGVGTCDCSLFHGTIDELAALAYQGARKPVAGGSSPAAAISRTSPPAARTLAADRPRPQHHTRRLPAGNRRRPDPPRRHRQRRARIARRDAGVQQRRTRLRWDPRLQHGAKGRPAASPGGRRGVFSRLDAPPKGMSRPSLRRGHPKQSRHAVHHDH